jgi:hypothetical protein
MNIRGPWERIRRELTWATALLLIMLVGYFYEGDCSQRRRCYERRGAIQLLILLPFSSENQILPIRQPITLTPHPGGNWQYPTGSA